MLMTSTRITSEFLEELGFERVPQAHSVWRLRLFDACLPGSPMFLHMLPSGDSWTAEIWDGSENTEERVAIPNFFHSRDRLTKLLDVLQSE